MDENKKRTILVLSNAKSLLGHAIVLECSTKKQNMNSIWIGKIYRGQEVVGNSYAMTDRLLSIPSPWLTKQNRVKQRPLPYDARLKIISKLLQHIVTQDDLRNIDIKELVSNIV